MSPRTLGWRGLAALGALDLLVLALLPKAPVVAAAIAGALLFAVLCRRPVVALSFATFGTPLFWPLVLLGAGGMASLLPHLLILVPLLLLAAAAVFEFPSPAERTHKLLRAARDPVFFTGLMIGLWFIFRLIGTPAPTYGRGKTLQYFLANLPLLLAGLVFFGGKPEDRAACFGTFTRLTLVFVGIFAALGIWNLSSQYWPSDGRLRILGVNPIWVARFTGTAMLLVVASWGAGRLPAAAALGLLVLYAVPFYATGSRGPLLALVIALSVWWLLGGRIRRRSVVAAGVALAGVSILIAIELGWILEGSPLSGHDASNLARAFFLKSVLDLGGSPGLLGVGTGGFPAAAGFGDIRLYPHNLFLEFWTELGVVGVGLLVVWVGQIVARSRLAWLRADHVPASGGALFPNERARLRVLIAATVFALLNAQVSGDVAGNALLWFWAGALVAPIAVPVAASAGTPVAFPDGDRATSGS